MLIPYAKRRACGVLLAERERERERGVCSKRANQLERICAVRANFLAGRAGGGRWDSQNKAAGLCSRYTNFARCSALSRALRCRRNRFSARFLLLSATCSPSPVRVVLSCHYTARETLFPSFPRRPSSPSLPRDRTRRPCCFAVIETHLLVPNESLRAGGLDAMLGDGRRGRSDSMREEPPPSRLRTETTAAPTSATMDVTPATAASAAAAAASAAWSGMLPTAAAAAAAAPFQPRSAAPPAAALLPPQLPLLFFDVDTDALVELAAENIDRIIAHNDQLPLRSQDVTRFHSQARADITVRDYLRRVVQFCALEKCCILTILVYMDRVRGRGGTLVVSSITVHRIIITAIVVATKTLCDSYYTNDHYAKVGGITMAELNVLEIELLTLLDWRLNVTPETLQIYYVNLARSSSKFAHLTRGILAANPPGAVGPMGVVTGRSPGGSPSLAGAPLLGGGRPGPAGAGTATGSVGARVLRSPSGGMASMHQPST